jgi:two-component system, OmpR family, alkaline phosphatase synthesis response regulator PhoP
MYKPLPHELNSGSAQSSAFLLSNLLKNNHDARPGKTGALHFPDHVTKILTVESNAFLQELLEVTFIPLVGWHNTQLLRAYTGRMGLRLLLQEQPEIVIFDLHMPLMNGLDMLKELQQSEAWQKGYHPHLIALTAQTQPHFIEQALELGVDYYYTKPFNPQALMEKVQDLIMAR